MTRRIVSYGAPNAGSHATRAERLHAALSASAAPVLALGPAKWRFRVPGNRRIGHAALGDDWLQLSAPLNAGRSASGLQRTGKLLTRNAMLPADVRIIPYRDASTALASAEIQIDEPVWSGDLEHAVGRGLRALSPPEYPPGGLPVRSGDTADENDPSEGCRR